MLKQTKYLSLRAWANAPSCPREGVALRMAIPNQRSSAIGGTSCCVYIRCSRARADNFAIRDHYLPETGGLDVDIQRHSGHPLALLHALTLLLVSKGQNNRPMF